MRFLSIILLILSLPASALGSTFTLWDEFPISQGANNFYAYGYNGTTYREIAKADDYYYTTPSQNWAIPTVGRTTDPWIYMHPCYQNGWVYGPEDAVLAWKPGNTVAYDLDISGSFEGVNAGNRYVYIRKDTEVLWYGYLYDYNNLPFNLSGKMLNPGETLYFGVNSNGMDYNDGTILSAAITNKTVPVPSALILMLSGLGGLWGWRRFK